MLTTLTLMAFGGLMYKFGMDYVKNHDKNYKKPKKKSSSKNKKNSKKK